MTFRTYWTSSILNHETVTGSKFFAEYIYNVFAMYSKFFQVVKNLLKQYTSIKITSSASCGFL